MPKTWREELAATAPVVPQELTSQAAEAVSDTMRDILRGDGAAVDQKTGTLAAMLANVQLSGGLEELRQMVTKGQALTAPEQEALRSRVAPLVDDVAQAVEKGTTGFPEALGRIMTSICGELAAATGVAIPADTPPLEALLTETWDVAVAPMMAREAFEMLATPTVNDQHRAIADSVIRKGLDGSSAPLAEDVQALADALAADLAILADKLRAAGVLLGDDQAKAIEQCFTGRSDMLALDALGADHVERLGARGHELAEVLREGARKRWAEFTRQQGTLDVQLPPVPLWGKWFDLKHGPSPVPFATGLADALWRDVVESRQLRLRKNPPSLQRDLLREVSRTFFAPGRTVVERDDGQALELLDANGALLATTPAMPRKALQSLQKGGARALLSVPGQRVFRHFNTKAHGQHRAQAASPGVLRFVGGREACAEEVGLSGHNGQTQLATILDAGRYFERTWHGDDGRSVQSQLSGLWLYAYVAASRRGPAVLTVTLNAGLMPNAMFLDRGQAKRVPQWLQPLTPMPAPYGLDRSMWGAQAAFQTELVGLLVDHRLELHRDGGARFSAGELQTTAIGVGLDPRVIPELLEHWTRDHDGVPAFLERVPGGRWHLARNDAYRQAREYLDTAGKLSEQGRQRALRGRSVHKSKG